jgi:hypothetical protein
MVKKVFNDHCVNQHKWGQFPCPNEDCKFVSYSQLCFKIHTSMHTRENNGKNLTHRCTKKNCGRTFQKYSDMERHLKIHDNDVIRCFYCQWAGTRFIHFTVHMNTHFRLTNANCVLKLFMQLHIYLDIWKYMSEIQTNTAVIIVISKLIRVELC